MKAIITLGILLITLAIVPATKAQITGYANIYAEVVSPAYIEKSADLTFSEINASANGGAVVLAAADNFATSGLEAAQPGKGTLAAFSIAGSDHPTFDITLPSETITVGKAGSGQLIVSDFTSVTNSGASIHGKDRTIKIGATLHIAEKQVAGTFADLSSFRVTFNYN